MLLRRMVASGSVLLLAGGLSACGLPGGDPPVDTCPVDDDSAENPIPVVLDANGDATVEGCAYDDLESDYYLFTATVDGRMTVTCSAPLEGTIGGFIEAPSIVSGLACPWNEQTNIDAGQWIKLEVWGGLLESVGDDPYTLTFHFVPD